MALVVVASLNPVKIETCKRGFLKVFPNKVFDFKGVSVPSGVSDQPKSEEETLEGAKGRAQNASLAAKTADFWVGIEGGVQKTKYGTESLAWIVVKGRRGMLGMGRTGSFFLPKAVSDLIDSGMELGDADDKVFGLKNSKQANGAVGILTGDILTRTSFYEPAVILALIPFKNKNLY